MLNFMLKLNPHFTDEDKENCRPIIDLMIKLANIARREGSLFLDEEVQEEKDFFLKVALVMVGDGLEPEIIKKRMQYMILADNCIGAELLNRLLIAEGALLLQQGENPRLIIESLESMLGAKYLADGMDVRDKEYKTPPTLEQFYIIVEGYKVFEKYIDFKNYLLKLPIEYIETALATTDNREIVVALKGLGGGVIKKIVDSFPANRQSEFLKCWHLMGPVRRCDVEDSIDRLRAILEDRV